MRPLKAVDLHVYHAAARSFFLQSGPMYGPNEEFGWPMFYRCPSETKARGRIVLVKDPDQRPQQQDFYRRPNAHDGPERQRSEWPEQAEKQGEIEHTSPESMIRVC